MPKGASTEECAAWLQKYDKHGHGYITLSDYLAMRRGVHRDFIGLAVGTSFVLCTYFVYSRVTKALLSVFSMEDIEGHFFLKVELGTPALTMEHNTMMVAAGIMLVCFRCVSFILLNVTLLQVMRILFAYNSTRPPNIFDVLLVCFSILVPTVGAYFMYHVRNDISSRKVATIAGFLTDGYKLNIAWVWEFVVLARKLIILAISLFIWDSFLQSFTAVIVLILAIVVQLMVAPFERYALNLLEVGALSSLLITQLSGILLWYKQQPDKNDYLQPLQYAITAVLFFVNGSLLAGFLFVAGVAFLKEKSKDLIQILPITFNAFCVMVWVEDKMHWFVAGLFCPHKYTARGARLLEEEWAFVIAARNGLLFDFGFMAAQSKKWRRQKLYWASKFPAGWHCCGVARDALERDTRQAWERRMETAEVLDMLQEDSDMSTDSWSPSSSSGGASDSSGCGSTAASVHGSLRFSHDCDPLSRGEEGGRKKVKKKKKKASPQRAVRTERDAAMRDAVRQVAREAAVRRASGISPQRSVVRGGASDTLLEAQRGSASSARERTPMQRRAAIRRNSMKQRSPPLNVAGTGLQRSPQSRAARGDDARRRDGSVARSASMSILSPMKQRQADRRKLMEQRRALDLASGLAFSPEASPKARRESLTTLSPMKGKARRASMSILSPMKQRQTDRRKSMEQRRALDLASGLAFSPEASLKVRRASLTKISPMKQRAADRRNSMERREEGEGTIGGGGTFSERSSLRPEVDAAAFQQRVAERRSAGNQQRRKVEADAASPARQAHNSSTSRVPVAARTPMDQRRGDRRGAAATPGAGTAGADPRYSTTSSQRLAPPYVTVPSTVNPMHAARSALNSATPSHSRSVTVRDAPPLQLQHEQQQATARVTERVAERVELTENPMMRRKNRRVEAARAIRRAAGERRASACSFGELPTFPSATPKMRAGGSASAAEAASVPMKTEKEIAAGASPARTQRLLEQRRRSVVQSHEGQSVVTRWRTRAAETRDAAAARRSAIREEAAAASRAHAEPAHSASDTDTY